MFSHCVDAVVLNYPMPGMGGLRAPKNPEATHKNEQRWATCGDRGGTTSGNRGPTESCPARN